MVARVEARKTAPHPQRILVNTAEPKRMSAPLSALWRVVRGRGPCGHPSARPSAVSLPFPCACVSRRKPGEKDRVRDRDPGSRIDRGGGERVGRPYPFTVSAGAPSLARGPHPPRTGSG